MSRLFTIFYFGETPVKIGWQNYSEYCRRAGTANRRKGGNMHDKNQFQ